jgi:ribosomal protein L11 methyltransferase
MLEGLPPNNAAHVLRLRCDEGSARRLVDLLVETFDPAEVAAAAFADETAAAGACAWSVEVYFESKPDEEIVRPLLAVAVCEALAAQAWFDTIERKDWVSSSLAGLKPVQAGRFLVHGAHDRDKVRPHDIALEIEAALAFGTGHHGTTRGCLLLLDQILRRRRPRRVLDVGTGAGVLAMAAAKALKARIACGDIDPVAVLAAQGNARLNGLAPFVRPVTAGDVQHPTLADGGPYDLIFANILAAPLRKMAPKLAAVAGRDAELVLSGLTGRDPLGVIAAYGTQGFRLARRLDLEGWTSLLMRRSGSTTRPLA